MTTRSLRVACALMTLCLFCMSLADSLTGDANANFLNGSNRRALMVATPTSPRRDNRRTSDVHVVAGWEDGWHSPT